ncbi:hypothetical protein [Blastococcus sp. SYSU D00820]
MHRTASATPPIRDAFDALGRQFVDLSEALSGLNLLPPAEGAPALADEAWALPDAVCFRNIPLEASQAARQLLAHTADHLHGLGVLLSAAGVIVAPLSLLRPTCESAATAHHLLEPGLDALERIRRWLNLQLISLTEQERLLLAPEDADHRQQVQQLAGRLLEDAEALGFPVRGKAYSGTGWPLERSIGAKLPDSGPMIAELLDAYGPEAGRYYHRFLSALVHAQPHGLGPFVGQVESPDWAPGVLQQQEFRTSVAETAGWLSPLIRGLDALVQRAAAYYGWPTATWDEEYGYTVQALAICVSRGRPISGGPT